VTAVKTQLLRYLACLGLSPDDAQDAIPAEAIFPPGAFPEGFQFIADLSIAEDGSPQGLRIIP